MIEIIEMKDRSELAEGRDSGMAFGFLKQIDENTYHTVQPLSPCKDFLNEVVFTENTGIPCEMYGLVCNERQNIYVDNFCFLGIKILKTVDDEDYYYFNTIEKDIELLNSNYKNIESYLNQIETLLELEHRTTITPAKDNYFLVKLPLDWVQSTVNISLYSLLLRIALIYDGIEDPMEFIKNYQTNGISIEKSLVSTIKTKLECIIERKKLVDQPPYPEESGKGWSPHEIGIINTPI